MSTPLKINVVGAGLVGLSAALAFRQQGHDVQVFEAAARLAPLGAVITIPPNATRVFERLGFDVEEACRPLRYEGSVAYKSTGEKLGEFDFKNYERPSWMVHRHDLHTALYECAVSADGPGIPVRVRLGARVTACDPEAGSLVTEDGTTHTADLLIGADGIKRAAFRALISTDGIKDELQWLLADGPRGMRAAFGPERRTLLFTPVRNNELVSVFGVHEDDRDQNAVDWNVPSSKEALLEKYADFDEKFKKLIRRADEVKLWQMRALPWHIETWIRGRTCIAGDAAHATLPTLGQGFAIGLEDVGALAFLLPAGTRPEDVEGRLRLFQDVRKARAEFVARESIEQAIVPEKQGLFMRSEEMRAQLRDEHKAQAEGCGAFVDGERMMRALVETLQISTNLATNAPLRLVASPGQMLSRRGWTGRDRCVPLHVRRLFRQAFCAPDGLRCQARVSEAAVALSVAPARVRQNKVAPPLPVRLSIVDHQGARHSLLMRRPVIERVELFCVERGGDSEHIDSGIYTRSRPGSR
ncbi:hypothetical protein EV122DRAFT_248380 [Schizophyllum commune]